MYSKEGYKIKYVKRGSMHTTACLNAIPKGAAIRTGSLITRKPSNERKSLSVLNPEIHKALREAGLLK